jgi:hypothetical protein
MIRAMKSMYYCSRLRYEIIRCELEMALNRPPPMREPRNTDLSDGLRISRNLGQ